MIKRSQIYTRRTGHVYTYGNDTDPKHIWVVLHGYGHLAQFFIRKFKSLDSNLHYVVCPEALSKFYLEGSAGRVGASWMTKHEREDEIIDYNHYLDKIYQTFVIPISLKQKVKIHIVGFSQGGATACRWYTYTNYHIDNIFLWGSIFPPDMDIERIQGKHLPIWVLLGDRDVYLPLNERESIYKKLDLLGLDYSIIEYKGGHDVLEEPLHKLEVLVNK